MDDNELTPEGLIEAARVLDTAVRAETQRILREAEELMRQADELHGDTQPPS